MATKLDEREQELVARKLVEELKPDIPTINLAGARACVADGDWDDHWLAQRLLAARE